MTGFLFNHGDGRIRVRFVQHRHGWMKLLLRVREGVHTTTEVDDGFEPVDALVTGGGLHGLRLRISAVFCPFRQMIAWLEAICLGLNHCSWEWEGEGPDYSLEWNGNQLVIRELSARSEEVRVRLPRRQIVAAFYRAFRRLVESPRYRPADYESRRVGEIVVESEGHGLTEKELSGRLLLLDSVQVESQLQRWRSVAFVGCKDGTEIHPNAYRDPEARTTDEWLVPYVTSDWDRWDIARRRARLTEVFDWIDMGHGGDALRSLRSEIVERTLAAAVDEQHSGKILFASSKPTTGGSAPDGRAQASDH